MGAAARNETAARGIAACRAALNRTKPKLELVVDVIDHDTDDEDLTQPPPRRDIDS